MIITSPLALPALTGQTRQFERCSNSRVRPVSDRSKSQLVGQICLTGPGWSQELIGQACLTRRQVLRLDSACPTTGRTWLFEHCLNCCARPVNAGSVASPTSLLALPDSSVSILLTTLPHHSNSFTA
ncbi:hypothetical protein PCASD_22370 [Puccinia coronata f. sp. avenae]|uniref:Uncharacterized protein n=1 Tax=Puccinia coronata f. sp. avenae TaxID=200324 RepID=A0A2N5SR81_9BASI|nr:hypothetical protein PCASD_22370 [Puccinia coronata f. sp. avenae]